MRVTQGAYGEAVRILSVVFTISRYTFSDGKDIMFSVRNHCLQEIIE